MYYSRRSWESGVRWKFISFSKCKIGVLNLVFMLFLLSNTNSCILVFADVGNLGLLED